MEFIFNVSNYKNIEENFDNFKQDIKQLKEVLKDNTRYENLYEIISLLKDKDIYLYFILFQNFDNWINYNCDNNINFEKDSKIEKLLSYLKSNNSFYFNIHSIYLIWIFYLYIQLINYFNETLNPNCFEINKIRYAIKESCIIIIKLLKFRIINHIHIYAFINLIFLFIETNFSQKVFSDKNHKAKNYILFNNFFFLLHESFIELNNGLTNKSNSYEENTQMENIYKTSIKKFFEILEEFKNNKEIISIQNKFVLINEHIIINFMKNILQKISLEIIDNYEPICNKILSDFFIEIIRHNFKNSKIYDSILYSLRQSFVNLYDFEQNKNNKIIKDLFINNFYSALLRKLLFSNDTVDNNPEFDCFYFNGYNSQISINIQDNNFEKSSLFFSFNLSPKKDIDKYPLFIIQKDYDKRKIDILKIYLKKDDSDDCFYLYEFHENQDNKLDYKIKSNITYYICVCFNNEQLLIKIYEKNKEIFSSPIIKKNPKLLIIKSISLTIGYYKKNSEVFSGFFGPVMILPNPKNTKFINDFISSVLKLDKQYMNYIRFCKYLDYIEEEELIFQTKNVYKIEHKIDMEECLLYLSPKNFRFFVWQPGVANKLPIDDDYCHIQDNYTIQNFNVPSITYEKVINEFINSNGLDYICLLYEYIYQFSENFYNTLEPEDEIKKNQIFFLKYITNVFKDTLFIIGKIYQEVKIENFTKNLKQIYMNLFSCLFIITKHSNIIDELMNSFYVIIDNYYLYFTKYIKMKIIKNDKNNNDYSKINLSFMNGWIDFLLNPEIYNYENKESLISLFNHLSKYFVYIFANQNDKVNQSLYIKLISFIDYLYKYYNFEDDINIENNLDDKGKENKIINYEDNENNIFNAFLETLTSFYTNNPSKIENINNLKIIFKNINGNLNETDTSFFIFFKFINKYLNKNFDIFFSDDKNSDQISTLIKIVNKLIPKRVVINKDNKTEKNTLNKCKIFDELINGIISILMRIILLKENFSNSIKIVKNFIIKNLEITNGLIPNILKEMRMIFTKYLLTSKTKNIDVKDNKKPSINLKYSKEEIHFTSEYYSQIFEIFKFILEDLDSLTKSKNNYEDEILDLFQYIIKTIKFVIKGRNTQYSSSSGINNESNNNFIDNIFCLINFLKFYNSILLKKIYSENFFSSFINICNLCCDSGLIYSTILLSIKENNSIIKKTILEIILDICMSYLYKNTDKLLDNPQSNDKDEEILSNEKKSIINFIHTLVPEERNSKDIRKSYTIFYINDYFRYLASINPKKMPKKDQIYNAYLDEFNNFKEIDEMFYDEEKFSLNFSTFFILKCNGYQKLIMELIAKLSEKSEKTKNILKYDDLLPLIIEALSKNYKEQEMLYSKSRNLFFPKILNIQFNQYSEIKKMIETNLKKKNYNEINDHILKNLFEKDFENSLSLIYSGLCLNIKDEIKEELKNKKALKKQKSINISKNNLDDINNQSNIHTNNDDINPKNLIIGSSPGDSECDNISHKLFRKVSTGNEFELIIESTSLKNANNKIPEDNSTIETSFSSPNNDKNSQKSKKFSDKSLYFSRTFNKRKLSSFSFISTNSNDSNLSPNNTYLNDFFKPDEYLLKNSKKQLMMSVFSIYFFDYFFHNESFKLMKNYYLENFDGIQKSTKLLNYPIKIKIFNNSLEPYLFFKPNIKFFENKAFPISHEYFYKYAKKKIIHITEPIILYKKIIPDFCLEEKFDKNCELIRLDCSYYGHMIGSPNTDFIIFEKLKYDFYEDIEDYKIKNFSDSQKNNFDIIKLFSLSYTSKKPASKNKIKIIPLMNKVKRFKRKKIVIIIFDEIEEIIERRFLLMWQAIEIFLKNGKSYFFNFLSSEQKNFILDIFSKNPKTKDKIKTKNYFLQNIKKITNEWQEEQLTTYEYLLFLNKYSTRTYNDINQYPVFPWITRKYTLDKGSNGKVGRPEPRNFKYPMASQMEERREECLRRYKDDEQNGEQFPIHYGTHYSTSSYIYFYLMREEPFTTLLIKLQGNQLENPDRMFYSVIDTLFILEGGHDNRESIPDLICKTEQYINLNCVDFGKKNNGLRVDDFNIYIYDENSILDENILLKYNNYSISDYVNFILKENIILNSGKIANEIIYWFDLVFGVMQLPEKNRENCLNIFNVESYEQKTNLSQIVEEMKKNKSDARDIIKTVGNKIDLIISFGQTPFQLFDEKHPKFRNKKKIKEKTDDSDGGFEEDLEEVLWPKILKKNIRIQPIYFEIYPFIDKIFLIDIKRNLDIVFTNFYDSDGTEYKEGMFTSIDLPHIKFFDKIKIKNNYYFISKQKYCFSPFRDEINSDEKANNSFHLYYSNFLKNKSDNKNKNEEIIFVTCRYSDNSFKIHIATNEKSKKVENNNKPISVICEDFVCSVCTLDHNKFLVGLRNGKLIQYSLIKEKNINDPKKTNYNIKVKLDKKIEAHKKAINVIEVDFRLGIIITAGDDNYLFIRKIYDFELITPIKFKSKYIITMAKVSPLNFLYVQCFNLRKNNSIIFGYTLNGLYFAKSKYAYYDSIDFTKSGNIVTFMNKTEIVVLNGSDLKKLIVENLDKKSEAIWNNIKEKLNKASWVNFNYICRRNEIDNKIIKCITFSHFKNQKKLIHWVESVDATDLKIFD